MVGFHFFFFFDLRLPVIKFCFLGSFSGDGVSGGVVESEGEGEVGGDVGSTSDEEEVEEDQLDSRSTTESSIKLSPRF